tara:strand:- start:20562 stop:21635 length:1074 start_codon:yes stop_codon:yes gene_type:complete
MITRKDITKTIYHRSANNGKDNFYSKIDNRLIKNEELSADSKIVMISILAESDSYIVYKENLKKRLRIGTQRFNKAWSELISHGYIMDKGQSRYDGKFQNRMYEIFECPEDAEDSNNIQRDPNNDDHQGSDNSDICFPHDGNLNGGNPITGPLNNENQLSNNNQTNQDQTKQDKDNQDQFEEGEVTNGCTSISNDHEDDDDFYDFYDLFHMNTNIGWDDDPFTDVYYYILHRLDLQLQQEWQEFNPTMRFSSLEDSRFFKTLKDIDQAWIKIVFRWILFINEKMLNVDVTNWTLNKEDIKNLVRSTAHKYELQGWEGMFGLFVKIADKAIKNNCEFVSVSYLTAKLKNPDWKNYFKS